MRKKFKIMIDGIEVKPKENSMFVCNSQGIFFRVTIDSYYPSITKLSQIYSYYDVVWVE